MANVRYIEYTLCHQPFSALLSPLSYTRNWIFIALPALAK